MHTGPARGRPANSCEGFSSVAPACDSGKRRPWTHDSKAKLSLRSLLLPKLPLLLLPKRLPRSLLLLARLSLLNLSVTLLMSSSLLLMLQIRS
jgi:hypothetical protein